MRMVKGEFNYILCLVNGTPSSKLSKLSIILAQILVTCGRRGPAAGKPPEPGLGQRSGTSFDLGFKLLKSQ